MNETAKVNRKMAEFFSKTEKITLDDANKELARVLGESGLSNEQRKTLSDASPDTWRKNLKRIMW